MIETLSKERRFAIQRTLLDWYIGFGRDLPWRHTSDPYAILVSEIMLQQTQVRRVAPKFLEFLKRFPDFVTLAAAGVGDVIRIWDSLGYNTRAVRIHRIAEWVIWRNGGRLPNDLNMLRQLEGLGEYTASAVACFAFGLQTPVVETNVRRVLTRLVGEGASSNSGDVRRLAADMLPNGRAQEWNQALMDLGATVCTARSPQCPNCPVQPYCNTASAVSTGKMSLGQGSQRRVSRFKGSTRYYRGRVLQRLRDLPVGKSLTLDELGHAVKPAFTNEDHSWLRQIIKALEDDQLVKVSRGHNSFEADISLP